MSNARFDRLSSVLANTHLTRRSTLQAAGIGLAGATLLARTASAQTSSPVASPEIACDAQDKEAIKALATRFLIEGYGHGDLSVVDEIYASDQAVHHRPGGLDVAEGADAIKDVVSKSREGFPDLVLTVDEVMSDGLFVVVRWTGSGTFTNPLSGIEPTGKHVTYDGINTFLFSCGKVIESWSEQDSLTRLGLVSSGQADAAATPQAEASPEGACTETTEEENVAIIEAWNDVWNTRDLDTIAKLAHPDIVKHFGALPDAYGVAAAQAGVELFLTAMPDLVSTVEDTVVDGDLVAVRYSVAGTQTGELFGVAPTGKTISWTGLSIYRIACGLVIENWSEISSLALWRQLGKVDAAATPAA